MKIALGITTWNRPEYAEKCIKAAVKQLDGVVDAFYVHNDGSDAKYKGSYSRAYKALMATDRGSVQLDSENHGVAHAKNALLQAMLDDGADWLFLCEDDIRILSPDAVNGYISVCESGNFQHLSFAHHGPANVGGPVDVSDDGVSYYPHSIGAWTVFSRECLETVGLFDEHFVCAWEHVEHEMRLIQAGFCGDAAAFKFPDATGSEKWLSEMPGSIDKSSIRPRPDWKRNIRDGLIYWRDNLPETFDPMFGEDSFLHGYAQGILS